MLWKTFPSNLITVDINPIETFYVELILRNNKWLINCSYDPYKSLIGNHLDAKSEPLGLTLFNRRQNNTFRRFQY